MKHKTAEFQLISQQLLNMTRYFGENFNNVENLLLADKIAMLNGLSYITQQLNAATTNIQVDINAISSKVLNVTQAFDAAKNTVQTGMSEIAQLQEQELVVLYLNFALSIILLIITGYLLSLNRSQNAKLLSFSAGMQQLLAKPGPGENRPALIPTIIEVQTTQQEQPLQDPPLEELALNDQGTEQRVDTSSPRSANTEWCNLGGNCFRPS